jgi:uncharacterized protein (TIGR02147 family)
MKDQEAIRGVLNRHFKTAQQKNSRYSLRSLATKLDVNAGTLSSIMRGNRLVSRTLAEKITRKLHLEPQERTEILSLFPQRFKNTAKNKSTDISLPKPRYVQLDMASFQKIFSWEYFCFLSLIRCTDFSSDHQWIAMRIGVGVAKVKEIIKVLESTGLVTVVAGEIKGCADFRTPDDVPQEAIKKFHLQTLELAKTSLSENSVEQRDFVSVTFALDARKIPEAKEKIRAFQDELVALIEDDNATEVYRLTSVLIPLTQMAKEKI